MKKFLINYFLFGLFFFAFFASGFVDSQDGFQYLAIARRIYYDQTFEMPVEDYSDRSNIHLSRMKSKSGKVYSPTGLGYSLSLMPAVVLEDAFLRLSGTEPISAFPLENDWPVLLFASMTNAFWGALLLVVFYKYLRELDINHKQSVILSFVFMIGTNLFVHTKHVFPHMMFVALMTLSLLLIKLFAKNHKKIYIFFAGFAYGLVVLTYNPTYLLLLPAYGLYYLFATKISISIIKIKKLIIDFFFAFLGLLPSLLVYFWFNTIRFGGATHTGYGSSGIPLPTIPPAYVILEGIWGLLLSPGKSIFLYSPVLLLLIFFWFKFKKRYLPELVAALTLFFVYLWNMGTLLGGVDFLVWHGDSSWGPRYMLPSLPLLFLIIGTIYRELSRNQKLFIFLPLILIGFHVNFLSILLPYQIRFAGLQTDAFFNDRNFNVYEYGNEIPRYMPVFKLSKTLVKRVKNIPNTFNHGDYNVRLIDGFDAPFDLGWDLWRGMRPMSYVKFDNFDDSIKKIEVHIRNHQVDSESSQSAKIIASLNNLEIDTITIIADSEKSIEFETENLLESNNVIELKTEFESSSSAELKKKQAIFLTEFNIDNQPQSLWTLDYPYVSQVSKGIYGVDYLYWGNVENNPWEVWHMHSGVYEQTFDLWWLRPYHYWDLPKDLFAGLFAINIIGIFIYLKKSLGSIY